MRPQAFFFTAYLLALAPATPADAETAAPPTQLAQVAPSPAARALGQKIGVAGAVRGEVRVAAYGTGEAVGTVARSGDPIRLGDKVVSGRDAGLQIMLLDETVFSIGPDAEMTIDEFVFDPASDAGKVAATIGKGAFRFITGRVATKDPQRMNVRLPQATIGIRGTIVAGIASAATSEVVLLGPGPENSANEKVGAITVANAAGSISIARTGFATIIAGQSAPTPPVLLSPDRVRAITQQSNASTAPRPPPSIAGGTVTGGPNRPPSAPGAPANGTLQAAPEAGMQLADARDTVKQLGPVLLPPPGIRQLDREAAQQAQAQLAAVTHFEQLLSVNAGIASFALNPVNFTVVSGSGSGFFGFSSSVNFGTRTLSLSVNANYTLGGTPYSGTIYNENKNYTGSVGPTATLLSTANAGNLPNFNGGFLGTGHAADIKVALTNNVTTGRIADRINVSLTLSDGTNRIAAAATQQRP